MEKFLPLVFLGGGLGASCRFFLALLAQRWSLQFWSATFFANLIGCLGIFLLVKYLPFDRELWHIFLRVGFLGGLTTFSSFSLEVVQLLQNNRYLEASAVFFLNMFFGIIIGIFVLR